MVLFTAVKIDTRKMRLLRSDIRALSSQGARGAVAEVLTGLAMGAQAKARENLAKAMTLRNKWSVRSVRVFKARATMSIRRQNAVVGAHPEYLARQERGGPDKGAGPDGGRIATARGSGEGDKATPRKKLPRGANSIRKLKVLTAPGTRRASQRRGALARALSKNRRKRGFMQISGGRLALVRVVGGKRRYKVKTIHVFDRKLPDTKRNPWLRPAALAAMRSRDALWLRAFDRAWLKAKTKEI